MSDNMQLQDLMFLVKLKNENPEEYKKTLDDMMAVSRDILSLSMKLAKEIADE